MEGSGPVSLEIDVQWGQEITGLRQLNSVIFVNISATASKVQILADAFGKKGAGVVGKAV